MPEVLQPLFRNVNPDRVRSGLVSRLDCAQMMADLPLTPKSVLKQSPGLMVMGRDSRSKGRGFESWHCILDGHFSRIFVVKIVMMIV